MDDRLHQQIPQAVDRHCAHLRADPLLAQKVLRTAQRKEKPIVKNKIKFGLILALILMLLAATAVAAVLLTGMEVIQQEAVPLAQGNDGDVRPVEEYTYEELLAIVTTAQENGIILDDDTSIMRALRMGEGYSEEETIMAICREAFGGLFYEWTTEEKHWFQEMMIQIGWANENSYPLPGEGEMTSAEARAEAVKILRTHYGADLPLDDPAMYRVEEWYYAEGDDQLSLHWNFTYRPRYLEGATYYIGLDKQGEHAEHSKMEPYNWEVYTEEDLVHRVDSVYNYRYGGCGMTTWENDAWYAFGQRLAGANKSEFWNEEYDAYAASKYLLPGEGDLTKQQARQIAFTDAGVRDYTSVTEILLGRGQQRVWKITFYTSEKAGRQQKLSYEINAQTHEILRVDDLTAAQPWAAYVLYQTYEGFVQEEDLLTPEDAAVIAVKALREHFGDETIPYTDESIYTINPRLNSRTGSYAVIFTVKQLGYGRANVTVNADGTASIVFANPCSLSGDNLFDCYDDVYGSPFDWEQSRWVEFGQAMQQYEPTTFEGKLFKMTTYVEESAVKLSKDDALDVVWKDAQTDHICAILIGAEPNPVWKVRANTNPVTTLYEIDAMTGEILDKELYYIQHPSFDHEMKMYTLRKDFMPAHLAEYGVARVAMELCVKAFPEEFEKYGDSPDVLMSGAYRITEEGMTVTFAPFDPRQATYIVKVAEDAMSAEVERIPGVKNTEDLSAEQHAALYELFEGSDRFQVLEELPEPWQANENDYGPVEGEMALAEAQAHAFAMLVNEVGQDTVNSFGKFAVGYLFSRFQNDGDCIRWTFFFLNPDDSNVGFRVTFAIRNNELWGTGEVHDINDTSNG